MTGIQFVTDEKGRMVAVHEYRKLLVEVILDLKLPKIN